MSSARRTRNSRSLSPPKSQEEQNEAEESTCERCQNQPSKLDKKKTVQTRDKSQQTRTAQETQKSKEDCRYANTARRNSAPRASYSAVDSSSRSIRQANLAFTKHEKEKVKMQGTIEKLQEAFCEKETKLQDARSQLVRERRMSEIMERQLKNARNLSEQLGRIIHEREQEIRTLKNTINKKPDTKTASDLQTSLKSTARQRKNSNSRDDINSSMRRSSSTTSEHSEFNSLSSTSMDKMLKEVHSLVEGLKIKDEAIKGLQEECTRRLDKIQTLQRSIQVMQEQLTQSSQRHSSVCQEKDNIIAQLQHSLKETESTVQSLLCEKSKVVMEGESTIQELQEIIRQKEFQIKKVQSQLEEAVESKELELNQLKTNLEQQQKDLDTKQKNIESISEELFSSQMEAENLKMELSKEKCSLNKMSEEINSLVDKLTMAVTEMENTKLEYQKKDERLKNTQQKIRELYVTFFGDKALAEKLQTLCRAKKECTGRKVLSEEDVIDQNFKRLVKNKQCQIESKGTIGVSNTQIHKQQLAELQQQVTESQTVCSILQEQLKEVTDFLDQLLHIEISPKNLSALSAIRQYGKQLSAPVNVLSISKERIAPDGVSSNSQLDIESSNLVKSPFENQRIQQIETTKYLSESNLGSCDNLNYYYHTHQADTTDQTFSTFRSISAGDVQQNTFPADSKLPTDTWNDSTDNIIVNNIQDATDSDEIILLINDQNVGSEDDDINCQQHGMNARPSAPSPPFQHGLIVKENYGSTGSINTREKETKENMASLERSASFGSFSGSVLMSYEQSGKASAEDSGRLVRRSGRCVRSIDMMDIIQVGPTVGGAIGLGLSSDSDIWSEPDMSLSRQRMGVSVPSPSSSDYTKSNDSSEYEQKVLRFSYDPAYRRKHRKVVTQCSSRKYASIRKRWLEKLQNYLHVFEDASYSLADEINSLCQVRTDLLSVISACSAGEKLENLDVILLDLSEYIQLNQILKKKVEKGTHYNRQLIEICEHKAVNSESSSYVSKKRFKSRHKPRYQQKRCQTPSAPHIDHLHDIDMQDPSDTVNFASDIQSQLIGYHATLLSCQDMIKDLHSQLKERHCNEILNKHELNRTVFGYLEDIDTCIEELCKKMETTTTGEIGDDLDHQQEQEYDDATMSAIFPVTLMDKLKENEDRLLRFESLLNAKEEELKLSTKNALQLEVQLNSIKHSLYEIQMENLELKECLEFSEDKQLEAEDSSNEILRELQLTMQRLTVLEKRLNCIDEMHLAQRDEDDEDGQTSVYPVQYEYRINADWQVEDEEDHALTEAQYNGEWASENY